MKEYLTAEQILKEIPEIKKYTLEYLVSTGRIQARSFGKGIPRKFPPHTIKVIRKILSERS